MRIRSVAATIAALALVAMLSSITPADAGINNILTVEKVVNGPVPEGTVFTVEVVCIAENGPDTTETFDFDANGDPMGGNMTSPLPFRTCTITETSTGGATVAYSCEVTLQSGTGPEDLTECVDDRTLYWGQVADAEAVFTVTNTFEPEPELQPEPESGSAGVVVATPTFTG